MVLPSTTSAAQTIAARAPLAGASAPPNPAPSGNSAPPGNHDEVAKTPFSLQEQ